jgi:membrane-associated phospholipid phosphatase
MKSRHHEIADRVASPKVIFPIALATAFLGRNSAATGPLAIGTSIAVVAEEVLKRAVSKRRPNHLFIGRRRSFPSGHSAASAAYLMGLAFMAPTRPLRWAGFLIAAGVVAGINVMRVREREHWTADVISGDVIGALAVGGTYLMLQQLRLRRDQETPKRHE